MKKYEKIDILTKVAGVVIVAFGIEYFIKMKLLLAMIYIGGGLLISFIPFFVKNI